MTKHALYAAAAILAVSAAIPAGAALHNVGSVDFSGRGNHDAKLGNFKAASMALIARGSDVMCNRVVATYGNGRTDEVFRGELPEGRAVRVDLREGSVDRVDFDCRPMDRGAATVEIAADDGQGFDSSDRYYRNDYGRDDRGYYSRDRYDRPRYRY